MMHQHIEYSLVPTPEVISITSVVLNGSLHSVRAGKERVETGGIT